MSDKPKLNQAPSHTFFAPYVIKELHKLGGVAHRNDIKEAVLDVFDIPDDVLKEVSGKHKSPVISSRIGWGMLDLSLAGYLNNPSRGYWGLTEQAKTELPQLVRAIDENDESELKKFCDKVIQSSAEESARRREKRSTESGVAVDSENANEQEDVAEQKALDADLEAIKSMDPFAFERLCRKLFKEEGYEDVENTQQTNDGGFDGVAYLVFGLVRFKVLFECKRFSKGSVSAKDLRAFIGTMSNTRAHKGVFITTSTFTQDARRDAYTNGDIELVNGKRLVELLKKHQIATKLVVDRSLLNDF